MFITLEYITVIILGLVTGSFANTIIYRIPRNQSIVLPNSFCPHCKHPIRYYDLIPIVSYINLRGKCRNCKKDISFQYPLVEALMAGLFVIVLYQWGFTFYTLSGCMLALAIVCTAFIDIKWGIIPDKITYPAAITGMIFGSFNIGIDNALAGSLFFGGTLLLVLFCCRGAMGGGDIKIALAIGFFTGLQGAVIAFLTAVVLGALYGVALIIAGRADRKTAIKFGPFLALGAFIGYNFAAKLSNIYFTLW